MQVIEDQRVPPLAERMERIARPPSDEQSRLATSRPSSRRRTYNAKATYAIGDLVEHPTFGAGVVRALASARVTAQFETGAKILVYSR